MPRGDKDGDDGAGPESTQSGGGRDTPVMRQFFAAKEKHPDALLFFRMGDFYELFFDDAVTASRALDLTLTSRNKNHADEIPMAGVPHHAASTYVQRLLDQGFKVAICEQMADPKSVKGIVPREVVRVVTPALAYDDLGLSPEKNAFLCAVEKIGNAFGVAALDVSTGEFLTCEASDVDTAVSEIVRLDPRELLVSHDANEVFVRVSSSRPRLAIREANEANGVSSGRSIEECVKHLDALLGAGESRKSAATDASLSAASRALAYAQACEPQGALSIARLVFYPIGRTLVLDESTQSHLELLRTLDGETKGALVTVIDDTKTAAGARLLRRRLVTPLLDVAEIRRRQDAVTAFATDAKLRSSVRALLSKMQDIERLATKLGTKRATARDLAALRNSLALLPELHETLKKSADPALSSRAQPGISSDALDTCKDIHELLARAIAEDPPLRMSDGGVIREGFDHELDEARSLAKNGQEHILALEARLRDTTEITTLKLRYTRVFGWYIEVTRAHVDKAPPAWRRKQTIANGERYTCEELDELARKLLSAEDRASALESQNFTHLLNDLFPEVARLRSVAHMIAAHDLASSLAEVAHRHDYACPVVDESRVIELEDSRHPVVEKLAAAGRFVPNDVTLDADDATDGDRARLWLVTGPNMAGKSTLMRQVALTVILAQMGSFVPARRARIGVVDRVLTRVGASDNLSKGESTFMVEMKETANVLRRSTSRSLVVLDEIGRGTSTYDGLSIAWAVAEYLYDAIKCRAMFATHYHELTALAETRARCANYSVTAREHDGELVFFHKLERGPASQSYGVACARLAGLPEPVLARARSVLADLELGRDLAQANSKKPQLGLFDSEVKPHQALTTLRSVDPNKLTPLEALNLIATLKELAERAS